MRSLICSWCRLVVSGPQPAADSPDVSHTICDACLARELSTLRPPAMQLVPAGVSDIRD
jgi:hypothetical protein